MNDILVASVTIITTVMMVFAAISDWKTREASDTYWVVIIIAGAILFACMVADSDCGAVGYLMVVSIILILVDLVCYRECSVIVDIILYLVIAVTAIVPVAMLWGEDIVKAFLPAVVIYTAMIMMYFTGIVRGGADAKATIAIAFAVPAYPVFGDLPIIATPIGGTMEFIVPAFSVLLIASFLAVFITPAYAIINLLRGDTEMPNMLAGCRMPLDKVKVSHVWPMYDYEDGVRVKRLAGFDDPDVIDRLREHGEDIVWVTPMIPFLVPIAAALTIILIIGNPLFLFI